MMKVNDMIKDNKGLFSEAVYDDNEVCSMCNAETLLFVRDLFDEIQVLRKEIVWLRVLANILSEEKGESYPYPFPRNALPGKGSRVMEHPLMCRYDEFFGEHVPKY
jgi:hypothetical protein